MFWQALNHRLNTVFHLLPCFIRWFGFGSSKYLRKLLGLLAGAIIINNGIPGDLIYPVLNLSALF
jgi:hypothetical protein